MKRKDTGCDLLLFNPMASPLSLLGPAPFAWGTFA